MSSVFIKAVDTQVMCICRRTNIYVTLLKMSSTFIVGINIHFRSPAIFTTSRRTTFGLPPIIVDGPAIFFDAAECCCVIAWRDGRAGAVPDPNPD